jgi:hypothetical protein
VPEIGVTPHDAEEIAFLRAERYPVLPYNYSSVVTDL